MIGAVAGLNLRSASHQGTAFFVDDQIRTGDAMLQIQQQMAQAAHAAAAHANEINGRARTAPQEFIDLLGTKMNHFSAERSELVES